MKTIILMLYIHSLFAASQSNTRENYLQGAALGGGVTTLALKDNKILTQNFSNLLNSSYGIIALSSVASLWSMELFNRANQQISESNSNIEKINASLNAYTNSFISVCPAGREDLSNLKCYCYTDTGIQNPQRTNSQSCQALWKSDNNKISTVATDYSTPNDQNQVMGCMTNTGAFDANCNCKKFNNCQKVTDLLPTNVNPSMAQFLGSSQVSQFLAGANNALNGNAAMKTSLSMGTANAINSTLKSVLTDLSKKGISLPDAVNLAMKDPSQFSKKLMPESGFKSLSEATGAGGGKSALSYQPSNADSSSKLDQLKKQMGIKESVASEMTGGKGIRTEKAQESSKLNLNFDGGEKSASGPAVQEFGAPPGPAVRFKDEGISKSGDSRTLFEVISHRYIHSALPRLYAE